MIRIQLLTPDGKRREHPEYDYPGTDNDLAAALRAMKLSRRLDTEATWLQRKGELGLWAPNLGQEAAQVGSAAATNPDDIIVPSYREHAVALMRGISPLDLLAPFRGATMIPWDPKKLHPYSFVIGSQTLHAVGLAQALTMDALPQTETGRAVLVYFGDGATSQGDVNESFIFAAAWNAPVVFLCQNNQWAISAPTSIQSPIPLYRRAAGFGFPGIQVDGNDVLAVHSVTAAALHRARTGGGPTLIEAVTYRMGAHTTSDDPSRYRSKSEEKDWQTRDPIARLETYLANTLDAGWHDETNRQEDDLATQIRSGITTLPPPKLTDLRQTVLHPGKALDL